MSAYTRDQLLSEAPLAVSFRRLVFPTIGGQLMTMIYNMTDMYFIGRVGNPLQVAAVSLVFPIYHLINALSNLYGIGGGSLISRLLGIGEKEKTKNVSAFSFWASIITVSVYSVLLALFMTPLLTMSGASCGTLPYCKKYLMWVAVIGGIPTMISLLMAHIIRSDGYGREAGLGMILGGAANIILDPVFINIFKMGVEGAAVATFISNLISVLFYLRVYFKVRGDTRLSLNPKYFNLEKQYRQALFSVGIPSALYVITSSLSNIIFNKLLSFHGDIVVAAAGVAKKVDTLPLNVCMGISHGVIPLLAYNYSADNRERMKACFRRALFWGSGICMTCIFLFLLRGNEVIRLFINDGQTVSKGAVYLKYLVIATPLMNVNILTNSMFQAVGKGRQSIILSLCRQGAVYIPVMCILSYFAGPIGIVSAQFVADTVTMVISLAFYRKFIQKT